VLKEAKNGMIKPKAMPIVIDDSGCCSTSLL